MILVHDDMLRFVAAQVDLLDLTARIEASRPRRANVDGVAAVTGGDPSREAAGGLPESGRSEAGRPRR